MTLSLPTSSLAQANLAWMRHPLDDPRMAQMSDEIDRINALGDRAPGCLWRFKTAGGAATDVRVLDDARVLFNLTVWRSVEDLRQFVYQTEHVAFFCRRRDWFVAPPNVPAVMWWVAEGATPSVEEAMARLDRLWRDGPSPEAFTFKHVHGPDGPWSRVCCEEQEVLAADPAMTDASVDAVSRQLRRAVVVEVSVSLQPVPVRVHHVCIRTSAEKAKGRVR